MDTFAVPRNGAVYSQGNEVIVPASGETAEDIARASAVEKSGVLLGGDLNILKPFDFINPLFLALAISNGEPQKELAKKAQGKSVVHIHNTDIQEVTIAYPSNTEQDRIVSVFRQLDNLITLHQRQLFLHSTPDISLSVRLIHPFYTSSWEQRKLEDYLTVSAEKNTGNIYGRSDVLSVSGDYGIVNQIEFQGRSFAGASVSNYGVVQTGDVVYTKSPLNSNPYGIIKTNKGKPGIVSTLYAVYHPKENAFSDFIQVYFEQHARMNNYMHPLVNKGAKNDMKVSAENALKGPVCFPSRIEQESISAFFSVLDNLITLHQRKGKAAVSGCFLNCFSLEKSSAQSRTLELFGQISNQEIKYIIDGLSILGGKLRNFCVKLIILLSYTRINDIAKYHISRNTECVHNIN